MLPGGSPPEELVLESLQRLADKRAISLTLSDERLAMLLCVLRSGRERKTRNQQVRATFGVTGRAEWASAAAIERDLQQQELLKSLFH